MPQGMVQALLLITPNSQTWNPRDLSNCIIRNAEATDSVDDMVRALGKLGTSEEPTMPDSKTTPLDGLDPKRSFPNMRTLHNIRKDWLSDEEMWLAIPGGATARQCLTQYRRRVQAT